MHAFKCCLLWFESKFPLRSTCDQSIACIFICHFMCEWCIMNENFVWTIDVVVVGVCFVVVTVAAAASLNCPLRLFTPFGTLYVGAMQLRDVCFDSCIFHFTISFINKHSGMLIFCLLFIHFYWTIFFLYFSFFSGFLHFSLWKIRTIFWFLWQCKNEMKPNWMTLEQTRTFDILFHCSDALNCDRVRAIFRSVFHFSCVLFFFFNSVYCLFVI